MDIRYQHNYHSSSAATGSLESLVESRGAGGRQDCEIRKSIGTGH